MKGLSHQLCSWRNPSFVAQELVKTWGQEGFIWLDGDGSELGRWITLGVDPIDQIICRGLPKDKKSSNPFEALRNLPPGHWTGWLGYEAGAWIEPKNPWKNSNMTSLWIASHDPILKFDLKKKELWLIGSNQKRLEVINNWLNNLSIKFEKQIEEKPTSISIDSWNWETNNIKYAHNVNQIKKFIEEGDIFQANLATSCSTKIPKQTSLIKIFCKLREYCPAPFGGILIGSGSADNEAVISTSPERFVRVLPTGEVETRPIKGTRPRCKEYEKDADMAAELICSPKDRAENIMIVDILRNDLGRVCNPGSINIPQLVGLESYAQVHHLTSVITGVLAPNKNWIDLLEACWPGGSISGAPKLRACQRLYELEPTARGPYCGSFINLNWDGTFDSNILIRSITHKDCMLRAYAGCGIVADSEPNNEAEEMSWKLMPILKALE